MLNPSLFRYESNVIYCYFYSSMFNKLFSEMNLNPQIFLFWFSLVKVGGGWWWNSDEVNISNR